MAPALLFVIVFFTIIVWRLLVTSVHTLARETAAPGQQHNNILEQVLHIARAGLGLEVVADSHIENRSDRGSSKEGEQPAETYLRRIVALTGARQMDNSYVLDAGTAQLHVRWTREASTRRSRPQMGTLGNMLSFCTPGHGEGRANCYRTVAAQE